MTAYPFTIHSRDDGSCATVEILSNARFRADMSFDHVPGGANRIGSEVPVSVIRLTERCFEIVTRDLAGNHFLVRLGVETEEPTLRIRVQMQTTSGRITCSTPSDSVTLPAPAAEAEFTLKLPHGPPDTVYNVGSQPSISP